MRLCMNAMTSLIQAACPQEVDSHTVKSECQVGRLHFADVKHAATCKGS